MSKRIRITSKDGTTLNTKNKYITDDLNIVIDTADSIRPENIIKDVTILGVTGSFEGVESTDATATPEDILLGKTAYVNNQKIKGNIETYDYTSYDGGVPENRLNALLAGSIKEFTFEDAQGVTSLLDLLFSKCNALEKIEVPNTVTRIGGHLFRDWYGNYGDRIPEIYYDGTFEQFLNITFNMYSNTYSSYCPFYAYTPNFYLKDENNEWYNINDLSYIKLPDNITTLKAGSLQGIKAEILDLNNVTALEKYSCMYAKNSKVIYANKLTTPGSAAFGYSTAKKVYLNSMTKLNGSLFQFCSSLEELYVPLLTSISDYYCFSGCASLKKIIIEQTDTICTLSGNSYFNSAYHITGTKNATYNPNGDKDGYIYVPASRLAEYKVATNWITYESQIIGHQDFIKDDLLPNYTNESFTKQTWYSDETLQNIVTNVNNDGRYYCRLEA